MTKAEEKTCRDYLSSMYMAAGTATLSATSIPLTMGTTSPAIGIAAGSSGLLSSCYVMMQEYKLKNSEPLSDLVKQLLKQESQLKQDNEHLKRRATILKSTIHNLEAAEDGLLIWAEGQGIDINRLLELTEENRRVIEQKERLIKGKICQTIMSTLIKCDDGDGLIDEREEEILCLRLNNIEGVSFHEKNMRQIIANSDREVRAIKYVMKDLLRDKSWGLKIFSFDDY